MHARYAKIMSIYKNSQTAKAEEELSPRASIYFDSPLVSLVSHVHVTMPLRGIGEMLPLPVSPLETTSLTKMRDDSFASGLAILKHEKRNALIFCQYFRFNDKRALHFEMTLY